MGVVELPDGEPSALHFTTVGEYAKAYMDWAIATKMREFGERLAALERQAELNRSKPV